MVVIIIHNSLRTNAAKISMMIDIIQLPSNVANTATTDDCDK